MIATRSFDSLEYFTLDNFRTSITTSLATFLCTRSNPSTSMHPTNTILSNQKNSFPIRSHLENMSYHPSTSTLLLDDCSRYSNPPLRSIALCWLSAISTCPCFLYCTGKVTMDYDHQISPHVGPAEVGTTSTTCGITVCMRWDKSTSQVNVLRLFAEDGCIMWCKIPFQGMVADKAGCLQLPCRRIASTCS